MSRADFSVSAGNSFDYAGGPGINYQVSSASPGNNGAEGHQRVLRFTIHHNSNARSQPPVNTEAQLAFNAVMSSIQELIRQGRLDEAELRLTEALGWAQKNFGSQSDQALLVLCIAAALYRRMNNERQAAAVEERIRTAASQTDSSQSISSPRLWKTTSEQKKVAPQTIEHGTQPPPSKEPAPQPSAETPTKRPPLPDDAPGLKSVLNRKQTSEHSQVPPKVGAQSLPSNIRRACQILGLPVESELTVASVQKKWKEQLLNQSAHPDLGGNAEEAILLNQAKTELLEYLEFIKPRGRSTWKVTDQTPRSSY